MEEEFDHWDEVADEMDQKVNQLVRVTIFKAEARAKPLARVDTGDMRNELYVRTEDSSSRTTSAGNDSFVEVPATPHNEAWLVGGSGHTIYNEFGTSRMSAQPMIVPGIESVRHSFLEALRQMVGG
jgi:HK97 gp10 family phage protein